MKRITTLCCFLFFTAGAFAQSNCTAEPSTVTDFFANQLLLRKVRIGGSMGDFNGTGGAINVGFDAAPASVAAVWGSSFWIGGIDTSGGIQVGARYVNLHHPSVFRFVAGPKNAVDCSKWDRFWSVEYQDILKHRSDFADGILNDPAEAILSWPGMSNPYFSAIHGFDLPEGNYAPFFDADHDGIYDPYKGDFPQPANTDTAMIPAKIMWSVFHDPDTSFAFNVNGLGFEYTQTIWAATCQDTGVLNETLFFSMRIKNTSGQRMDSVVAGIQTNMLFGKSGDDCVGTSTDFNALYFYNKNPIDFTSQSFHGQSFGKNPPAAAWTVLNKPLFKSMYYFNTPGSCDPLFLTLNPDTPFEFYQRLNGHWNDGSPLVNLYEGYSSIYDSTNLTDFIFTGSVFDPQSWSMNNVYPICFTSVTPVFSINLGTLQPNQSETIDYAYSFHRDTSLNNLQQIPRMFGRIGQLREMYTDHFKNTCEPQIVCTDDCVWPGDANHDGIVNYRDIIPIGLMLGKTGPARTENNSWGPKHAENWGQQFDNQFDIKHADCNGDGIVDTSDLALLRYYLYRTTPDYQPVADTFQDGDELAPGVGGTLGALPENVKPEDRFLIRPFLGAEIEGLRSLAYDLEFDSAYWSLGAFSESFTVDSSKFSYRLVNDSASTQIFVLLDSDFQIGKYGVVLARAKAIQPNMPKETMIRLKNIEARLADGTSVPLGSWPFYFCFGGGCATSAVEPASPEVRVYPRPSSGSFFVEMPGTDIRLVKTMNVAGQMVDYQSFEPNDGRVHIQNTPLKPGFYMVELTTADNTVFRTVQVVAH